MLLCPEVSMWTLTLRFILYEAGAQRREDVKVNKHASLAGQWTISVASFSGYTPCAPATCSHVGFRTCGLKLVGFVIRSSSLLQASDARGQDAITVHGHEKPHSVRSTIKFAGTT